MRSPFSKSNDASRSRSTSPSRGTGGGDGGGDILTNYLSFPPSQPPPASSTTTTTVTCDYRGFSTSIGGLFQDSQNERVDCCAITCCGVFQTDRDRFLMQGVPAPSPLKRCAVHFLLPLLIFLTAGLAATHVSNPALNQTLSTALILGLFFYFWLQCIKGRSKRIEIRKDLLWFKYQLLQSSSWSRSRRASAGNLLTLMGNDRPDECHYHRHSGDDDDEDESDYEDAQDGEHQPSSRRHRHGRGGGGGGEDVDPDAYLMGQSRQDLACAHPFCWFGLYAADDDSTRSSNCCFCCRRRRLQFCGLCAVAQEGREIERLLPDQYRRIDYITMQPVVDFYPAIYQRKYLPASSSSPSPSSFPYFQVPPLSRLSIRILQTWAFMTGLLLTWAIIGPIYWKFIVRTGNRSHAFSLVDFGIYILTFAEAIAVLLVVSYLVHSISPHRRNKVLASPHELSVDAFIKYFASGFFLSTSLAIFWELVGSLLIKIVLSLSLAIAGIDVAVAPDTSMHGKIHTVYSGGGGASLLDPLLWYHEHDAKAATAPAAASSRDFLDVFGKDHPVVYTLYLILNAFFLAALIEELCKYFGYRMVEHPDFMSQRDLDQASLVVHSKEEEEEHDDEEAPNSSSPQNRQAQIRQIRREQTSQDYSLQRQSLQAQGAAVTLAMVAVAMGFTCCENLVYIFIYSSVASPRMELYVLISRSFFPVHPIAAAIQSVGVCRRDLEGLPTSLLQIVLPSILFHGGYDFFILFVDFLAKRHGVYADENNNNASDEVSLLSVVASFVLSLFVMAMALVYLRLQCKRQRTRLEELDRQSKNGTKTTATAVAADQSSSLI